MKFLPLLLVFFIVAGIASPAKAFQHEEGNKELLDSGKVAQLVIGKTTKAEVRALFGEPRMVAMKENGWEKWLYSYSNVRGGLFRGFQSDNAVLGLVLDEKGILRQKVTGR